jgi:hypothetical protein
MATKQPKAVAAKPSVPHSPLPCKNPYRLSDLPKAYPCHSFVFSVRRGAAR